KIIIYACTVIKFIVDRCSPPTEQLDIIQNRIPQEVESPFEALDQLYIQIPSTVPARSRSKL
ncbi:hypothetical protein FB451DRAFT_1033338, partial [Mycena latifolia]